MKRYYRFMFLVLLCVSLSGLVGWCSCTGANMAEAEDVVDQLFEAVRNKDFDKALTFYSPEFFEDTSHSEWLQILNSINAKLGDLQSYNTTLKQTGYYGNIGQRKMTGIKYTIKYKVQYSKYTADETIIIFKPAGNGELKITGHGIQSIGLLKE